MIFFLRFCAEKKIHPKWGLDEGAQERPHYGDKIKRSDKKQKEWNKAQKLRMKLNIPSLDFFISSMHGAPQTGRKSLSRLGVINFRWLFIAQQKALQSRYALLPLGSIRDEEDPII